MNKASNREHAASLAYRPGGRADRYDPCSRLVAAGMPQQRAWPLRTLWRLILLAAATASPLQALAWGDEGHRLIVELAQTRLTDAARAEVNRLLALEPGATLGSVSTWADEVRSPATSAWHYVNFARDAACYFTANNSCVQGQCVVGAIEHQLSVLASKQPDDDRLTALKYVTHLVADVHQPLHAGFADDRGGNDYQVHAFGRGTNLHAVWDSGLIHHWPGGAGALRAAVQGELGRNAVQGTAARWAEASCTVVATPGFYPDSHQLNGEYQARWAATVVIQLAAAARRLAVVLNQALPER